MLGDGGAGAAASAVREKGKIGSRGQIGFGGGNGKQAELDEMVSAAAGAELRPGLVEEAARDRQGIPIGGEDLVFERLAMLG